MTNAGYEKQDVSARKVAILAIIGVLLTVIVVIWLVDYFIATKEALIEEVVLSPESVALRELRARELQVLTSYGLVDAEAGIYRIPIERAMRLMAEEAYSKSLKQ